ncbi:hypothetical protein FDP41_002199 [Naegleria fowleri]|uniref:DUF659 domain-containing protein n=1 Tax=Naegleria fowleri TaxID=5763 RepID=A0A6A5C1N2_NAEFO|nr:uncharacterized protein FDP41_002199 [Naegleria fowleri]KAF0979129.1 hypothetical protein FDP41_002199 [Naegleria fowleri]
MDIQGINVVAATLTPQKNNRTEYHYILNLFRALKETHIPIRKLEICNNAFQHVFFGKKILDVPSDSCLSRHMKAISRAIDEIINDKLRHAPGKITRMIDESDGFVSIFYNMIEHLNEEELEIISEQYTMLLRKQLHCQEDTRKMYQLERQLKLKYKRTTICSKIQPMLNQTAQTLFETVKQAESGWNGRRVDFMMSDNGANVIAVAKPTMLNVTLITCCGHNLNLVYKHFITCYKDFERHVGRVIRKLRSDWKSLRWLVTILKFDFQFVENYFNSQDGTIIIDDDLNFNVMVVMTMMVGLYFIHRDLCINHVIHKCFIGSCRNYSTDSSLDICCCLLLWAP